MKMQGTADCIGLCFDKEHDSGCSVGDGNNATDMCPKASAVFHDTVSNAARPRDHPATNTRTYDLEDDVNKTTHSRHNGSNSAKDTTDVVTLYEAVLRNDVTDVKSLLQRGCDIEQESETDGRTPLQQAVQLGFYDVATYLIFHGADPTVKTKDGQKLADICRHSLAKATIGAISKLTVRNDNRRWSDEPLRLSSHKVQYKSIGVSVRSATMPPPDGVTVRCRSLRVEDAGMNLDIKGKETLYSEAFVLCSNTIDVCTVTMRIPLYSVPGVDEQVVVKTSQGRAIQVDEIVKKKKRCYCKCTVDLPGLLVLAAVSTPRTEILAAGPDPICLRSSLEPKLKLSLPIGTFEKPTNIRIHIKDVTNLPAMLTESQCIFSSTPLFLFDCDDTEHQQRDVIYYVPLPVNFGSSGQLIVLAADDHQLAATDDGWHILPAEIITRGRFKCSAKQIRVLVGLQFAEAIPEERCTVIARRHVSQLYRSVCHEEFSVVFHIMSKPSDTHKSLYQDMVVTCCSQSDAMSTVQRWKADGYNVDWCTDACKTLAKLTFCITLDDKHAFCDGQTKELLQFHQKRDNYVQFKVQTGPDYVSDKDCHIQISQMYTHKGDKLQDICVKVPLRIKKCVYKPTDRICNFASNEIVEAQTNEMFVSLPKVYNLDTDIAFNSKWPNLESIDDEAVHKAKDTSQGCSSLSLYLATEVDASQLSAERTDIRSEAELDMFEIAPPVFKQSLQLPKALSAVTPVEQVDVDTLDTYLSQRAHNKQGLEGHVTSVTPSSEQPTIVKPIEEDIASISDGLFFHDSFLRMMLADIGEDWCNVYILMGIPFAVIDAKLTKSATDHTIQSALFELLQQWRDDNSHRPDKGVPQLLSALRKGGRWSMSINVQKRLKIWHDEAAGKDDSLHQWLDKAYRDSDLYIPGDYPPPMCDKFLVMVASHLPPSDSLAGELSLATAQFGDMHDMACANTTLVVMKMLTTFRDQSTTSVTDQLETLLRGFENIGSRSATSAAVTSLMGWLYKSAPVDHPLRAPVERLLRNYKHVIGGPRPARRLLEPFDHRKRLPAKTAERILRTGDVEEDFE